MKIIADLHIHTVSSGHAYSTLEEYIARAKKIGLRAFALTDHGPAMPGAPHIYHFANMRMIPKEIDGIRIYRGIEANIISEKGEIDIAEQDIKWGGIEIIMLAMHPRCGYENMGEEKNTEVLLQAMQNPYVNVIAHPGNPKYPINIKTIAEEAKKQRILLEINNSSGFSRPGSYARCLEAVLEVKRVGGGVAIGSDSHLSTMLGIFDDALKLISEAGLPEEQIVNTSLEKIDKYLRV